MLAILLSIGLGTIGVAIGFSFGYRYGKKFCDRMVRHVCAYPMSGMAGVEWTAEALRREILGAIWGKPPEMVDKE
jgi:hypothetical protein